MLTDIPHATATFTFTGGYMYYLVKHAFIDSINNKIGIAIYFFSPLWPYRVNVAISLDSGHSQLVPLVDTSRPDTGSGPATVASNVVWSSTGLDNIQHTISVSVAPEEPYAIIDGLMSAFFHRLFLSLPLTLGAGTPR
jgi:hypothetical protein